MVSLFLQNDSVHEAVRIILDASCVSVPVAHARRQILAGGGILCVPVLQRVDGRADIRHQVAEKFLRLQEGIAADRRRNMVGVAVIPPVIVRDLEAAQVQSDLFNIRILHEKIGKSQIIREITHIEIEIVVAQPGVFRKKFRVQGASL